MSEFKLKQGPITQQDLMSKLAAAKKVMKKVDGESVAPIKKSTIQENYNQNEDYFNISDEDKPFPQTETPTKQKDFSQIKMTNEKIMNSKIPDNIKKAMMEHPIPSISLNSGLDVDFIESRPLTEQEQKELSAFIKKLKERKSKKKLKAA